MTETGAPKPEPVYLPAAPGAYVLVIDLPRPLSLVLAAAGPVTLAPGRYAYCGNAYGPGGLNARIRRHLRRHKSIHWHVDRLTAAGTVVAVMARPGGDECDLLAALAAQPGVTVPVPGFGSSDCRTCSAHLVALGPEVDPARICMAENDAVRTDGSPR